MSKTAALIEKLLILFAAYAVVAAFSIVLGIAAPVKAKEGILYMQNNFLRINSVVIALSAYLVILGAALCCHSKGKYKDISFYSYWGKSNFYYISAVSLITGFYYFADAFVPCKVSEPDSQISTTAYKSITSSVICLINLFNIYRREENLMVGLKWVATLILIHNFYALFWSAYVFLEIPETLIGLLLGFVGCWLAIFIRIDVWLRIRFVKKRQEPSLLNGTDF